MSDPLQNENAEATLDSVIAGLMPDAQTPEPQPLPGQPEAGKPVEPDRVAKLEAELAETRKTIEASEERRRQSEAQFYRESEARRRAEDAYRRDQDQQRARAAYFEQLRANQIAPPEFTDDDLVQNPSKVRSELHRFAQQVNARQAITDQQVAQAYASYQSEQRTVLERDAARAVAEAKSQLQKEGYDDFDEIWEGRAKPEFEAAGDMGRRLMADPIQVRRSFLIHRDSVRGLQPNRRREPVAPSTPANPSVRSANGKSGQQPARALSNAERVLMTRLGADSSRPFNAEEQAILDASRAFR